MTAPYSPVYQAYYTRMPWQLFSGVGWKRLVAFRADESGVTLGGPVTRYRRFTAVVPWRDIEAVVLWSTKKTMERPIRRIGLKLRQGVPDPPGPNHGLTPQLSAGIAPHIEHEVVRNSRFIALWKVDHALLATAMQAFAPQVQLRVHPVHKVVPQGPGTRLGNDSGGSIFDILP
ncbi:hypothetical protein [Streptomyces malaysiensis]|uniref:Uncharacterized protein n=1 Tax=Streptomyces malaysiensis subsp. samsunensis TaxID=459658 RepID=A0A9X2M4B7_STRMQ|nr:hypothetical protein [Streptomyces samsunensis]MCQ8834816.1 hypothetical protein [Streptomyces samsunensis]